MIAWLVDNLTLVYLILAVLAMVWVFVVWLLRQNATRMKPRTPLVVGIGGIAVLIVLAVGATMLGMFVQTDQSMIEIAVREMANGIKAQDADRVFAHVSDDFDYRGMNKARARQFLATVMQNGNVSDMEVWDLDAIERVEPKRGKEAATIGFKVKPKGNWGSGAEFYRCKATFVRDADGKWRLQTFELFDPARNQPITVPVGPGI